MNRAFILIYVASLILFSEALSQKTVKRNYPFLARMGMSCEVRYEKLRDVFYYSYSIFNDPINKGNLSFFEIDISRNASSVSYDTIGLVFRTPFLEKMFRRDFPSVSNIVVPVGFAQLPNRHWMASLANRPVAYFAVDTLEPKPGENTTGFVMISKAPPGIRSFKAVPDFNVDRFYPAENDTANIVTASQVDSIRLAVNFLGTTIAPTAPPYSLIVVSWIDTLLSYTRQSTELGWLGRDRDNDCDNDEKPEDGIVRNIEQRLRKAKRQLERRDSVLARRELEKLVSKVERLWKRSQDEDNRDKRDRWEKRDKVVMTSEAYALLKYNTEYLIDRLPDRKPKKGSKDRD